MKTFKLMSFDVFDGEGFKKYPLDDGIIINQESSHQSWVLEIFGDAAYAKDFEQYIGTDTILEIRAVISHPNNEPASLRVLVQQIKHVDGNRVSILFKGQLKTRYRQQYAELLLEHLVKQGIEGEELIRQFDIGMKTRPRLVP